MQGSEPAAGVDTGRGNPPAISVAAASETRRADTRAGWRRDAAAGPIANSPKHGFFPGLDLLRGFAAVSVVVYHVINHFKWTTFPSDNIVCLWFRLGWIGVDLFFVISGFVIALSALKLLEKEPAGYARIFCTRRLARIVPLHYLTCLIFVVFLTPGIMVHPKFWAHALSHLTFTHNWHPQTVGSINGANWSLGVEMQFYLLILLVTPWLRRARPLAVLATCIAVSWAWRAAVLRSGMDK